jgi:hypothetical protein
MASEDQASGGFTEPQRERIEQRRIDQDRTLLAMHELEDALGTAAPAREARWRETVLGALVVLSDAIRDEAENAERPDSLLSDVAFNQPRLRSRVRGLRTQYRQLQQSIDALRRELEEADDAAVVDFADIRQRLAWLLTALRHQRARDSDLIYEAYYEAFRTDLGRHALESETRGEE